MDEPELVIALAISRKPSADQPNCAAKQFLFLRINTHAVTPAAPMWGMLAQTRIKIPAWPLEPLRARPDLRMLVHAGCNFTQHLERLNQIFADARFRSSFPVRQNNVARSRHALVSQHLDEFIIFSFDRRWCLNHTAFSQVHQPCKFRCNRRIRMISITVNAQSPALPVRRFNLVCRILRQVD